MAGLQDCQRVAKSMVGEQIVSVTYVGLFYGDDDGKSRDIKWDFGDMHCPEVGVMFEMESGRKFFAIWDDSLHLFIYQLLLAEGDICSQWLPLRDDPEHARAWQVGTHKRWQPFIGTAIDTCSILTIDTSTIGPSQDPTPAPVAMRIACGAEIAWIVAAGPYDDAVCLSEGMEIGKDEIMVLFGDSAARSIGLEIRE